MMVPVWYLDVNWVAYWDMYRYPENLPPFSVGLMDLWWIDADREEALKSSGALR
jgi:microcin C transport system substrate-binding protein